MSGFDEALRAGDVQGALDLAAAQVAQGGPRQARALCRLAQARIRAGQLTAAVEAADQGLAVDTGEYEPDLRMVLSDAYERLGELDRASDLAYQALGLVGDLPVAANAFEVFIRRKVAIARISERRGRLLQARYFLDGVLIDAARAIGAPNREDAQVNAAFFHGIEPLVHLHRGRVARKLSDHDLARAELAAALAGAQEIGDAETMMYCHLERSFLEGPALALDELLEALWWHQSHQATARDDELRVAIRSSREELYQRAVHQAVAVAAIPAAWRLSEQARAKVYLARIGAAPDVAAPETSDGLAAISHRVASAAADYSARPSEETHRRLSAALENKVEAALGTSLSLFGPGSLTLEPGTGLLEYFVTQDGLVSFLVTADEALVYQAPYTHHALTRKVGQLRELIEVPGSDISGLATQLHRWLIEPFDSVIARLERLIVVPYGALAYLPFAMLGEERALMERVTLSYAPSAAIVGRLLQTPSAPLRTCMVAANPHPDDDRLALPCSEDEAERLVPLIGAQSLIGPAATTSAVRAAMADHDVVHLACHAWFDRFEPRNSSVILADPQDPRRPGRLTMQELNESAVRAKLVVLSGCQTGLADLSPGGELDGLVRAAITAGVQSVVASMWQVDDLATADLMAGMYDGMAHGLDIATALRNAQTDVRSRLPHPYFWAGFGLFGSWRGRLEATQGI